MVVKKLSDVTYRVQEVKARRRRLVIHFNRLKPFKGKIRNSQPLRGAVEPPEVNIPEQQSERHYFGSQLELTEEDDADGPGVLEHTPNQENVPQAELPSGGTPPANSPPTEPI